MSESKRRILNGIRRSLERGILSDSEMVRLREGLENPNRNTIPQQGRPAEDERHQQFMDRARQETATVEELSDSSELPAAIGRWLERNKLPKHIVVSPHPKLTTMDWQTSGLESRQGLPEPEDLTGVTTVFAGIAETGTLCVCSSTQHPYSLNLLPDNHIAIVERSRIVGCYEECWDLLREEMGRGIMPRTLLWITGPSMTGDIEQTLMRGAHGPRRLHILVI